MPKTPNYDFERKERERLKALKKQEKLAAKAAAKEKSKPSGETEAETTEDPTGRRDEFRNLAPLLEIAKCIAKRSRVPALRLACQVDTLHRWQSRCAEWPAVTVTYLSAGPDR